MITTNKNENDFITDKCNDCGACGTSTCCSPIECKMTFNSEYCKDYLNELRFTYEGYHKLYELVYANQNKNKELFSDAKEIIDDLRNKYGY